MNEGPPLRPLAGRGDAWEPLVARFSCERCGAEACTLTLLPPFAPDPQAPSTGTPRGDMPFQDAVRLSIDGPVKTTHTFVPDIDVDLSTLDAALRAHDAERIFGLDREYAPFWCRACEKSYCRDCWAVWVDYDEGFYDCTRGRCPEGHERIMDD